MRMIPGDNFAATPTIGAGYPRALLEFAVAKGADGQALLDRAGLCAADLSEQDKHVPLVRYAALIDAAAELTGEPAIALQFGEAVRMQEISIVGLICEACERTTDVGVALNRYAALVVDDGRAEPAALLRGVAGADGVWIEGPSEVFTNYPKIAEAEFARLVWNARVMFADTPDFQTIGWPLEMHFRHAAPAYVHEHARIFQAPVVFNSRWNAMRIDPAFLALKQPPVNRYVFGVLSERADAMLKRFKASRTTRGRVETLLMEMLHTGEASMDAIAAKLALSRRTLHRRLKAEGATFEQVLDDLRRQLAHDFLAARKVTVSETAYLLGFSDPAAFSRAFKRWTGESPSALRRH
jgi:AraC-like DNA-binding protein